MSINEILDLFPNGRRTRPNKFTMYIGEQIRIAREEAGYSQEKLAKKLYLRRPTLSDIENGKVDVDASTLGLLSYYLKKPFTYFFPKPIYEELVQRDMDEFSVEMQMQFEQIYGDDLKRLAIKLVKDIGKFDPSDYFREIGPAVIAKSDKEENKKFLKELGYLLEE
jgi:transcriptional regulator with XRE-family HTH domain